MTSEMYLTQILDKKASNYYSSGYITAHSVLSPIIRNWAGTYLEEIFQSGSSAKGTAIKGKSDVDIFISISSYCPATLKSIFDSLEQAIRMAGYPVRRQNVSIGTRVFDYDVDLVPGKKDVGHTNFHKLYVSKADSWKQTNVKLQISHIQESNRAKFIQLVKIWRDCHNLEFPSINIELAVLEALYGSSHSIGLADGFWKVLKYLDENICNARLVDPGNTNNVVSEDMTQSEKAKVAVAARASRNQPYWRDIIW